MARAPVDVVALIAEQKFRGFHALVLALCALAMFADGFDTQIVGYIAPNLTRTLGLAPGALGSVQSLGGLGIMLGSLFVAPIADFAGRKRIIVVCLWFFAAASFGTAFASNLQELTWLRLATGLALGGLTPNALALAAEYMPTKYRVARVTFVWVGYSIGSSFGGPVANYILAHYNWQGVFVFGGIMPIIAALIVMPMLPESVLFLARRGAPAEKIARLLKRAAPGIDFDNTGFVTAEKDERGVPASLLFKEGRAAMTLLLWVIFFMNLSVIYFLNSWLPTILNNGGLSENAANNISAISHIAGIVGGLIIAFFADRWSRFGALATASLLSAIFIVSMGLVGGETAAVATTTLLAGFFTFGVQNTANAIGPTLYPTALRSTGAGWATGIGRISAVVAPWVGGILLSLHWPSHEILYVVALPAVISVLAALAIGRATAGRMQRSGEFAALH